MSARVDEIWETWNVTVECYGCSIEDIQPEAGGIRFDYPQRNASRRALAVYGQISGLGSVLLFVVSPAYVRPCFDELLDSCVAETSFDLAEKLRKDMAEFKRMLNFDLLIDRLLVQGEYSGKRHG